MQDPPDAQPKRSEAEEKILPLVVTGDSSSATISTEMVEEEGKKWLTDNICEQEPVRRR